MKVNQKDLSDLFKEHQQDVQTIKGGFKSKWRDCFFTERLDLL